MELPLLLGLLTPGTIATLVKMNLFISELKVSYRGAWVAQLVECPTLCFGLGHDLRVLGPSPPLGLHAQ